MKLKTKNKTVFVCKHCHNSFERHVYPSRLGKTTFEFCSPSCRNKARALPLKQCPLCGKMFSPKINDTSGERKKHCSAKCGAYSTRGRKSSNPKTHTNQTIEFMKVNYPEKGADWISKKLGFTKSAIQNLANRLGLKLGEEIYKELRRNSSKRMLADKNPNWQGGITTKEWGDNWRVQQRKARQRDDYTCQVCDIHSRHIPVHHIKRRRFFTGHMEDANILTNLICLCNKHHILVEMGKIPCPTPKLL